VILTSIQTYLYELIIQLYDEFTKCDELSYIKNIYLDPTLLRLTRIVSERKK
jgi:hypothetical protein